MEDAFEEVWWRRDVATAWVLTRDRTFVQQQFDRNESDVALDIAFTLYAPNRIFSEIPIPSTNEAWETLHRKMMAGKVRTVGEPFQKIDLGLDNTSTNPEPARDIPDAELMSMQPFKDGDKEFLVHISWSVAHGSSRGNLRGYQNVRLLRSDVMAAFPVIAAENEKIISERVESQEKQAWNKFDEPHYSAMKQLIEAGSAVSVADAARQVVATGTVAGSGAPESRQKRLARKYPKWDAARHSQQIPNGPT